MRMTVLLRGAALAASVAIGFGTTTHVVSAQSVFERAKRAAEDAARAREGQKSQPAPPQTPQTAPASRPPTTTSAAGVPAGAASGDCCSPEALKAIAASVGFSDIVGIKLGMTPEQAFAAVKAHNARMKIDIVNSRMEYPDGPQGNFTRVPQYAVAHTVGLQPFPSSPAQFRFADGSSDVIVMEFTIPPSPPLVAKIVRELFFPQGQPVVASNLKDALRKKYGQEKSSEGVTLQWMYDAMGKPVTRPLQGPESACLPGRVYGGFQFGGAGQMPAYNELDRDALPLNVSFLAQEIPERSAICRPFTIGVAYPLGEATPPNQQMASMTVMLQSPALLYASQKASHDWLKAKGDAKTKQLEDAAKARTAPKL